MTKPFFLNPWVYWNKRSETRVDTRFCEHLHIDCLKQTTKQEDGEEHETREALVCFTSFNAKKGRG